MDICESGYSTLITQHWMSLESHTCNNKMVVPKEAAATFPTLTNKKPTPLQTKMTLN